MNERPTISIVGLFYSKELFIFDKTYDMAEIICFNFASRSRPKKFYDCLDNIREMVNNKEDYFVLAKIDSDQIMMYDEHRLKADYPEVIVRYGNSMSKVHAINRGIAEMQFDILCNHSDDMKFIKKGFDDVIRANIEKDIFLHFPDQAAGEKLCTYSIMDFTYFMRTRYIYNPGYKSLWCDNEAQEVAKKLGRYKFVNERILDHLHPANDASVARDKQYDTTEAYYYIDKRTFDRRKRQNFDL